MIKRRSEDDRKHRSAIQEEGNLKPYRHITTYNHYHGFSSLELIEVILRCLAYREQYNLRHEGKTQSKRQKIGLKAQK